MFFVYGLVFEIMIGRPIEPAKALEGWVTIRSHLLRAAVVGKPSVQI